MLSAKLRKRAVCLALVAAMATGGEADAGRFSDMVSGGLSAARSVGGSVARRGTDVARRGASVARSAASQGAVVARSAASRSVGVAQNVASRGVGVAQNVTARGVNVAQNVASRGAGAAREVASRGVGVAQNVATRGVNVVGSAANRARLAQGAIQNRLNPVGAAQNLVGIGNGAVAAGVARFASATPIAAGAPQGIIGGNGIGNGVGLQQLKSGIANRTHNALNAVAAIPPKVVNGAGQVAQAAGLPALPPNLKQAVNDVAALPQMAANIPVGAIVKSKAQDLGIGQGQIIGNVAAAGQQVLPPNLKQAINDVAALPQLAANIPVGAIVKSKAQDLGVGQGQIIGDALDVAQQLQEAAMNPGAVIAANGEVAEGAIAGVDLAADIVEIVDAAQPDLLAAAAAAPIPVGAVRSIVANRPVSGGGSAAPATFVDEAPVEEAPFEEAPQQTFAEEPAAGGLSNADLVLEDLQLAAHATAIAGPAYRLQFRNQGSATATDFYVVLLAGVGATPAEDAPRAVLHVASVAPGEAVEAILRLPAAAMQMVDATGARREMTHVFVSLDFTDAIVEIDETNNLAIVEAVALTTAMR